MTVWIVLWIWITRWRSLQCIFSPFRCGVYLGYLFFTYCVGGVLFLFFVNCETIWDGLTSGS